MDQRPQQTKTQSVFGVWLKRIFIAFPRRVFNAVDRRQERCVERADARIVRRLLWVMLAAELAVIALSLMLQRDALKLLQDAFLATPIGGALALAAKLFSYLIRTMFSFDQFYAEAKAVEYAMDHIPETVQTYSVWLLSFGEYVIHSLVLRAGAKCGLRRVPMFIHSVALNLAYGVIAALFLDHLVWSEHGLAAFLFAAGSRDVLRMVLLAAVAALVLALLALDVHLLFASLYEAMVVGAFTVMWGAAAAVAAFAVLWFIPSVDALALLKAIWQDPQQYRGMIMGAASVGFLISFGYLHGKHAQLLEVSPQDSVEAIEKYFSTESKDNEK